MAASEAKDNASPFHPTTAQTTGPDMLAKLPVEIRAMVFDILYGESRSVKVITRTAWKEAEINRKARALGGFKPTQFPQSSLSHLIVDKVYFEYASRAWMRSKTFCFSPGVCFHSLVATDHSIHLHTLRYVTRIDVDNSYIGKYSLDTERLPMMRSVSVCIPTCSMMRYVPDSKVLGEDDFTDMEISQMPPFDALLKFRRLEAMNVRWEEDEILLMPRRRVKWAKFKRQAEALLKDVVTKPKESRRGVEKVLTLEEAFRQRADSGFDATRYSEPESCSDVKPLERKDLPHAEDELTRLCLTRPKAFLKWIAEKMED